MRSVKDERELYDAVNDNEAEIIIENPKLGKIIIKIKHIGKAKWVLAVGAIAIPAMALYLMAPALASGPAALPAEGLIAATATGGASIAIAILGMSATIAAIKICFFSKGKTEILNKIRNGYDIIDANNQFVLKKK